MRYAVTIREGLSLSDAESLLRRVGAQNIKVLSNIEQIFCDLTSKQVEDLRSLEPRLRTKLVEKVSVAQELEPLSVYSGSQASSWASRFYELRELFTPPLLGEGFTVCVLDTGIRKTHASMRGKVIYEKNLTTAPTAEDVFSHGTGVAFLICGGRHAPSEESGIAPGAKVMNIKILDDEGVGTIETLIEGLDHCLSLLLDAQAKGLSYFDPMFPNGVNLSLGLPDDGDPEHPVRVAIRTVKRKVPFAWPIFAVAGNDGPEPETITLPGAAAETWTVGAATFIPFDVWEKSSRGPVKRIGIIKPDLIFYGVSLLVPSGKDDFTWELKSGTSFSTPIGMGGTALLADLGRRLVTPEEFERYIRIPRESWEAIWMLISVKAPDAPLEKDNTWGLGMPMGHLMVEKIRAMDISAIAPQFLGLALMGALAGMIRK